MNKIFGRDKVIERIWRLLQEFSILFTAERRVGKTTVLNELENSPREGFRVIYSDLEKIDSPIEFIADVLNKTEPFISKEDRAIGWFNKLWMKVGGTEVAGIKIPEHKEKDWKKLLQLTIKGICDNTDKTVVFLWDELPYMLQKINSHELAKDSAENSSLQIMDTLRALRQEQKNLRMIFTGSIGLHHVLNTLTNETYASESVNDLEKVELSPLDKASAEEMVKCHLKKEGKLESIEKALPNNIAQQCDFIPFYMEKLIRRLAIKEGAVTQALVDQEIAVILTDASDDWELEHFRSRLSIYYKGDIKDANEKIIQKSAIAKSILNHCAAASTPQSIDDCYKAVKSHYSIDDRGLVIEILNGLVKDHYLRRDTQAHYQFYFSLVQRWWVLAEGLRLSTGGDDHA